MDQTLQFTEMLVDMTERTPPKLTKERLKTCTDYCVKLLSKRVDFENELEGFMTSKATYFGFNDTAAWIVSGMTAKQVLFSDGRYEHVMNIGETVYAIFLRKLYNVNKIFEIKSNSLTEYHKLCLENVIVPLVNELNALHIEGIYHKDIKPENIMAKKDDSGKYTATFIDFGLSQSINKFTFGAGTAYFMSPAYLNIALTTATPTLETYQDLMSSDLTKKLKQNPYLPTYRVACADSFFKQRSFLSYEKNMCKLIKNLTGNIRKGVKDKKDIKDITDKITQIIAEHNDYYALGISIHELCSSVIPIPQTSSKIVKRVMRSISQIALRKLNRRLTTPAMSHEGNYVVKRFDEHELNKIATDAKTHIVAGAI